MDKITYTPGRLARKLGLSKGKLMDHLRETGLIEECFASKTGRWQIPYDVAVKISSVETLALSTTQESKNHKPSEAPGVEAPGVGELRGHDNGMLYQRQQNPPTPFTKPPNYDYAQIGKTLRVAGVTMSDLIKYIQQQVNNPTLESGGLSEYQKPTGKAKD